MHQPLRELWSSRVTDIREGFHTYLMACNLLLTRSEAFLERCGRRQPDCFSLSADSLYALNNKGEFVAVLPQMTTDITLFRPKSKVTS